MLKYFNVESTKIACWSNDEDFGKHKQSLVFIHAGAILTGGFDLDANLHAVEKTLVAEAIRLKDGNREATARLLKMKPHTFRERAKEKFGL